MSVKTAMELHILPHRLHIASFQKKHLGLFSHSLIKHSLLHQHTSCKFFSFTETCDDFSFIIDEHGFKEVRPPPRQLASGTQLSTDNNDPTQCSVQARRQSNGCCVGLLSSGGANRSEVRHSQPDSCGTDLPSRAELLVQPTLWLVLNAIPSPIDADGNAGLTKTTKCLVMLLADKKVSIYCLSTYQTDFVLVKEGEYDNVIQYLQPHFNIFSESDDGEMIPVTSEQPRQMPIEPKSPRPIVHSFQSPDNRFLMTSLQPELLSHITTTLLQLMFYSDSFLPTPMDGHERFLSLSIINDKISLVVDTESLALFPSGSVCTGAEEYWRMIKIGNLPLGFDESGIAAQISQPLAESNIPMYYISTFLNDHTLVSEVDIDNALSILKSVQGLNTTGRESGDAAMYTTDDDR